MVLHEVRWLAWLHLRSPRSLSIEQSFLTGSAAPIPLRCITSIATEKTWFPLSLLSVRISITYRDGKTSSLLSALGNDEQAKAAQLTLSKAVESTLAGAINKHDEHVAGIEEAHRIVYVPLRYVRHSKARQFAEAHGKPLEVLEKSVANIYKHPLLAADDKIKAAALTQRITKLKPFTRNIELVHAQHNEEYALHHRTNDAPYFDNVENQELTEEQVEAALVFEDATLTVAAAGSGKSSCIVAKIGFALKTGLFQDHQILALAYNRDAAKSLKARLDTKLSKVLNREVSVASKTFHAFGLSTLLKYHGDEYEPKVLKEDDGEEGRYLKLMITSLIENDVPFQSALAEWLLFSPYEDPQPLGVSDDLDACAKRYEECCRERIREKRVDGRKSFDPTIPTLNENIYVRSLEERTIANWLILRGVNFEYEAPDWEGAKRLGLGPTENKKSRPYTPDFTYRLTENLQNGRTRKVRVVHEHFGLDANGRAPVWMGGNAYEKQSADKRKMFEVWARENNPERERVAFFETSSAQVRDGSIFECLERSLRKYGVPLTTPNNEIYSKALAGFRESSDLERLIINFVLRFKDSGASKTEIEAAARTSPHPYRAKLFLRVAFHVFDAYQQKLKNEGKIDFADMLRDATDVLRTRRLETSYRLILVDEFQDIAQLKANLVKAVLDQAPDDSIVFCVGDDWQTINRFAGSDISIFTGIGEYFDRHTKRINLSRTFRCAQGIADVSRALVMRNKGQIDKEVVANTPRIPHGIRVVEHGDSPEGRQVALCTELDRIENEAKTLQIVAPTVLILRRTEVDTTCPEGLPTGYLKELSKKYAGRLTLRLLSVHGSKGLEADFVILPGVDSGFRGFPDERPPEPLLDLVLPKLLDPIEEERRLFYVGLTRARHQAIVLTNAIRPSEFVLHLEELYKTSTDIEWIKHRDKRKPCPKCKKGSLILPYEQSLSLACSRTERCGYKERKQGPAKIN